MPANKMGKVESRGIIMKKGGGKEEDDTVGATVDE